jgi:hypothetical protein
MANHIWGFDSSRVVAKIIIIIASRRRRRRYFWVKQKWQRQLDKMDRTQWSNDLLLKETRLDELVISFLNIMV